MILGIDVGTQVARAAIIDADGEPRLVATLPMLVRQTMHGMVIGEEALRSLAGNAETTVCGPTRLMGRAGELASGLRERLPHPIREVGGEVVCDLLYAEVRASEIYGRVVAALVEAVARDTRTILPVSFRLQDEYGLSDIALSVPACIGAGGVDHVVPVKMSASEEAEFKKAAEELRASMNGTAKAADGKGGEPHA